MKYQFFTEHNRVWVAEIGVRNFCQTQFKGGHKYVYWPRLRAPKNHRPKCDRTATAATLVQTVINTLKYIIF